MIVQRGYMKAGSFHSARLETAPLGHFFHVISNGYGAMPDYAAQITPADRWAIVAYIKALQLSQKATQADVPAGAHVEPLAEHRRARGPAGIVCRRVDSAANGGDGNARQWALRSSCAGRSAFGNRGRRNFTTNANRRPAPPAGQRAPQQTGVPKQ